MAWIAVELKAQALLSGVQRKERERLRQMYGVTGGTGPGLHRSPRRRRLADRAITGQEMDLGNSKTLNEAFAVTRMIPIAATGENQIARAIDDLERIESVDYAKAAGKGRLKVRYDASGLGFREIERLLDEAGIGRPSSVWWRLRSAWYAFVDENARSNAKGGSGACCNRPPGMGGGN